MPYALCCPAGGVIVSGAGWIVTEPGTTSMA